MLFKLHYYMFLTYITTQTKSQPYPKDLSVQGLKAYFVFLTEYDCMVNEIYCGNLKSCFPTKDIVVNQATCSRQTSPGQQLQETIEVQVPDYFTASLPPEFTDKEENYKNRQCTHSSKKIECTMVINFEINKAFTVPKRNVDAKKSNSTQTANKVDSNIWVYVGVGGAVVILIVLIQTGYIISYSRKVVITRRALENVLHSQEERREANDRYSVGPVPKKRATNTHTDGTDDLYESLEHLTLAAAKDDGGSIKSYNIQDRPPMPLPHELLFSDSRSDNGDTIRSNGMKKTAMLLPREIAFSENTLPRKTASQKVLSGRSPAPGLNITATTPWKEPKVPQNFPPNILPLKNTSAKVPSERFLERPTNASMTSPRVAPKVLPRVPVKSNIMNELNTILSQKQNSTVDSKKREGRNSSDDEWTYEELPPVKKYLQ